jgi:two-component system OmpR family response regulator
VKGGAFSTSTGPAAKILIVDDEPDLTAIMKKGLQRFGFQVDTFNNPLEVLSSFEPQAYDVAILDIRMPQMSGYDLYPKLQEKDSRLKICFMTSYEIHQTLIPEIFPNFDSRYFIRKPVSFVTLASTIKKLLSNQQ